MTYPKNVSNINTLILIAYQNELKPMEVWKVGKTFLIHCSSSMLLEMIVSNVTCINIEYIRLKHAKWLVWPFKSSNKQTHSLQQQMKNNDLQAV
ncbi:hypothetical protein LDENG_00208530 [Lucifuga dentata]|nr:hypothetical protein LDENG_00208530 [Lucifuga dentata]